MLLWSSDRALRAEPVQRFSRGWISLLLVSLCVGVGLCLLHGLAWKLLGETAGILLLPGLAAGVAMGAVVYRRAIGSLSRLIAGADVAGRSAVAASCVLAFSLGVAVVEPDFYWWGGYWPTWLGALGPHPAKVYRILPLLPLWGAWSMLATVQFCRPGRGARSAVTEFARGCGPFATAGVMAVLMAGTIQMLSYWPWWQLAVSAVGVVSGVASGLGCCLATGGLTRRALLAANVLTQLGVLFAYIAVRNLVTL
jgi:hypothetical protein